MSNVLRRRCEQKGENACLDEKATPQERRFVSDTQAGALPEKYVVVTSNELVRVKYVLLYAQSNEVVG